MTGVVPSLLGHAIAFGLLDPAVFDDGEGEAGDVPLPHLRADELIDGVSTT